MWIDSTSWHKLILCRFNNQTKVYKKFILVAKRLKLTEYTSACRAQISEQEIKSMPKYWLWSHNRWKLV